jgi:hypothetical protein
MLIPGLNRRQYIQLVFGNTGVAKLPGRLFCRCSRLKNTNCDMHPNSPDYTKSNKVDGLP